MGLLVASASLGKHHGVNLTANVAVLPVSALGRNDSTRAATGDNSSFRGQPEQFLEKVTVSMPARRHGVTTGEATLGSRAVRIGNAQCKDYVRSVRLKAIELDVARETFVDGNERIEQLSVGYIVGFHFFLGRLSVVV